MNDITALAQRMKGQTVKAPYYLAECTHCGEMYPSNLLNGGEPLFAGDYNDCLCPHCNTDDSLIADLGAGEETAVAAWNFQQKRIDALVEALEAAENRIAELEKSATEPVAWTEKCEITNMQATGLYLRGFPGNSQGRDIALYTVPPVMESRTVTVKLPERQEPTSSGHYGEGYLVQSNTGSALDYEDTVDALRAAGIQVIEGEGQ